MFTPAIRSNLHGRASGGILFGIKNSLLGYFIKFKIIENKIIFQVISNNLNYFIIPVYLNCNNWNNDFDDLVDFMNNTSFENVMIIGDFNARIGQYQNSSFHDLQSGLSLQDNRTSKDKIFNGNGRKATEFFETFGLSVLNGSSYGDACGEFTFISGQGQSVIDFAVMSRNWLRSLQDFEVAVANFSAHMPIVVKAQFIKDIQQPNLNNFYKLKWSDSNALLYQRLLNRHSNALIHQSSSTVEEICESLIRVIKSSSPFAVNNTNTFVPLNKWFDKDCRNLRKLSFVYLRLFRKTNSLFFKHIYLHINKEFKQLCLVKKTGYLKNLAVKLENCKDSKSFWSNVRELGGRNQGMKNTLGAEALAAHFKTLLSADENLLTFDYALPDVAVSELDISITFSELEKTLHKMKNNKAPGIDGIPVEFFKNSTVEFKNYLLIFFNRMYEDACVPSSFSKAVIFAIFKKGDANSAENYRGISILNTIRKIFSSILYERLTKWVEDNSLLNMFQAGFRAGFSTMDHIFSLSSIARKFIGRKKKLYTCFVDFKAAFDKVNRQALIYKLSCLGISRKFLLMYSNFIASSNAKVWDGSEFSDWFETTAGVPQGCILSPLLFALFIDEICDLLPGGVLFSNILVKVLLYADDLVMLADNPASLQMQVNKLQSFCLTWGLQINIQKTKVLIFEARQSRRRPEENWCLNNERIEVVQEFKYLGVLLTHNLNFTKHSIAKCKEAKLALNMMWPKFFSNQNVDLASKYRVFNATVNASMSYGVQVFGYIPFESFESLHRHFFKRLFRLPNSTPNYAIYVESGITPIYIQSLKANADFIVKIMRRSDRCLHKTILKNLLHTNASPFKEWKELAFNHDTTLTLSDSNINDWEDQFANVIAKVDSKMFSANLSRATSSTARNIYRHLNHSLVSDSNYFRSEFTAEIISVIFRTRVEILNLNFIPHRNDLSQVCNLCNRRDTEDINHFLAVCPILQEIRRLYFQESFLSLQQLYEILNGEAGWLNLYKYCQHALTYRNSF